MNPLSMKFLAMLRLSVLRMQKSDSCFVAGLLTVTSYTSVREMKEGCIRYCRHMRNPAHSSRMYWILHPCRHGEIFPGHAQNRHRLKLPSPQEREILKNLMQPGVTGLCPKPRLGQKLRIPPPAL